MIRILVYLVLLALAAAGLSWFADNPGAVTIRWPGYEAEPTLFQAFILLALTAIALAFLVWLTILVFNAPGRLARYIRERRRRKGFKALQEGIFAAGAGDTTLAARSASLANKLAPNEPLTQLLRAQAAQLAGDRAAAQRIFTSMLDNPSTKLLALRGLFLEAKREGQMEAARHYVERALDINPSLPWPATALFEFQCQARDWNGALNTLSIARHHRIIDRQTADRRRAVLLTALAMESEEKGDGKTAELALEAHRLAPDLVPAAAIAGRALAAQGNTSKAAKVLAETWELSPHPDLAIAYAHARPGDSPRDRLARVKTLASLTPGHPEAAIAVADAAISAREWREARSALDFLLRDRPSARVCALMARIEGGERRDAGRVREWLARALRAPRDPAWIADGVVSDEWAPLSPLTGAFDAYVWETPPEQVKPGRAEDRLFAEIARFEPEIDEEAEPVAAESAADAVAMQPQPAAPQAAVIERAPATAAPPKSEAKPAPSSAMVVAKPAPPAPPPPTEAPPAEALPPAFPASSTGWEPGPPDFAEERPLSLPPAAADKAALSGALRDANLRSKTQPPKIFVPERPPDDPGPEAGDANDDADTLLARFRMPLKDTA